MNYLNIPKINLKELIIDYKDINKELSTHYKSKIVKEIKDNKDIWILLKKILLRFKNEQKSTISYMVKEFEMKK